METLERSEPSAAQDRTRASLPTPAPAPRATARDHRPDPRASAGERIVGDDDAGDLESLVRDHQRMVWRYLRLLGADGDEADDLMQETFLRVARGARTGEVLHSPAAFLRGIARNLLLAHRRTLRRRRLDASWVAAVDELVDAGEVVLDDHRLDALRDCRERLGGRARAAIDLHHVDGLAYRDAARRLGIGTHGFKSLLSRARQLLRDCMDRHLQGERER